jgi:hypothetical protein
MNRWTALLILLFAASSASAWSDHASQYFCEAAVNAAWGPKVVSECLGSYGAPEQAALCAMYGDRQSDCENLAVLQSPALLPNALGEGELEQAGPCPVTKTPESTYLCSKRNDALNRASEWVDAAKQSPDVCGRVRIFCVASSYLSQTIDPFNYVVGEDARCRDVSNRRVDMALANNQTPWGTNEVCVFNYNISVAGGFLARNFTWSVPLNDKTVASVLANLTSEAKAVKLKPLPKPPTTTTTSTTLAAAAQANVSKTACASDLDCVVVPSGCCGCESGGAGMSVSSNYSDVWLGGLGRECNGTACPAVMSQHISCYSDAVCQNSTCVLKPDTNVLCKNQDIKANCAGEAPSFTPGSSRTYGVSCGYINYLCGWAPTPTTTAPKPTVTTQPPATVPPTTQPATPTTAPAQSSSSNLVLYAIAFLFVVACIYLLLPTIMGGGGEKEGDGTPRRGLRGLTSRDTRIESYGKSRLAEADNIAKTRTPTHPAHREHHEAHHEPAHKEQRREDERPRKTPPAEDPRDETNDRKHIKSVLQPHKREGTKLGER